MCNQTSNINAAPAVVAGVAGAATYTTHTAVNPSVPNVSILRFPNGIFEMHLYLPGVVSNVEIVPHNNYLLVRGQVGPRLIQDVRSGHVGALIYTDRGIGDFSRDVPICLAPGTEFVILETRQECHDYIVRYTIRNSFATGYCAGNNGGAVGQPQIVNQNHGCGCGGAVQGASVHGVGAVQAGVNVVGGCGVVSAPPIIINRINTLRTYATHSIS